MTIEDSVKYAVEKQRAYFSEGHTMNLKFRLKALAKLKKELKSHEREIYKALQNDLGKSQLETFMTELVSVYKEISYMSKNIKKLAKKRKVANPVFLFPAKSYIQAEPLGCTLLISPWNYPIMLTFKPLIGAIAAGNCAIVKSSELSPHSSALIKKIIESTFDEGHVCALEGGVEISTALLAERFDFIFYTGSTRVGKIVMEAASKNLTPVCLELGGKSPTIVLEDADLKIAAKRILFGKVFNAGQTCIAPDYILAHEDIKSKLIEELQLTLIDFLGADSINNPDYPRIINERSFDRLIELAKTSQSDSSLNSEIVYDRAKLKMAITIIDEPSHSSALMQEEIFGPLLPVIGIKDYKQGIDFIQANEKPLAAYLFTENSEIQEHFSTYLSAGGICINDTLMHLMAKMPFGGVGMSGMGKYFGKASFDLFSHLKGVLNKSTKFDPALRYPPFPERLRKIFSKK